MSALTLFFFHFGSESLGLFGDLGYSTLEVILFGLKSSGSSSLSSFEMLHSLVSFSDQFGVLLGLILLDLGNLIVSHFVSFNFSVLKMFLLIVELGLEAGLLLGNSSGMGKLLFNRLLFGLNSVFLVFFVLLLSVHDGHSLEVVGLFLLLHGFNSEVVGDFLLLHLSSFFQDVGTCHLEGDMVFLSSNGDFFLEGSGFFLDF